MEPVELAKAFDDGNLDAAAERIRDEREKALARGDLHSSASELNDLGVVYYLSGKMSPAREALEGARDEFVRIDDGVGQARAMGNLARVEEKCRNRKAALALYQQAADLFHEADERSDEFATLRSLSQLYLRMGGWLQALATYDRGLTIKPHPTLFDSLLHRLYQIPLSMIGMSGG